MYSNKLAAAIKVNNRVLRENGDKVYLPFGSEYSISLKNLNTRRAIVHIDIDGTRVTGDGLVIRANQSIDLERFIDNGDLTQGNRFKFIERTANVERARGIFVEDGLVRVEFEFEKELPQINWDTTKFNGMISKSAAPADVIATTWLSNSTYSSMQEDFWLPRSAMLSASASATSLSAPPNEAGITVKGSVSNQTFTTTTFNGDGVKEVMVLKLLGETMDGAVEAPVTVKDRKIFHIDTGNIPPKVAEEYIKTIKKEIENMNVVRAKCTTCNHQNPTTAKFCSECGTSLIIV